MTNRNGGFDKTRQPARPPKHEETVDSSRHSFEHKEITDNRLVWEVLEEGEK